MKKRYRAFMDRRPHRSFRMTRRRDYIRPIELPKYGAFVREVWATLWRHKKTFGLLAITYAVLYLVLVGAQSQDDYASYGDLLSESSGEFFSGNWGAIGQASILFMTVASSNFGSDGTEAQQIFAIMLLLMVWLTVVWLLRNLLAGHKVKLRDGVYNAGAPLFATVLIALLIAVQLVPVAFAAIGYSAALSSGLLDSGIAAMLFWFAAGLLGVLSLYWVTSSLFAMVIVTLPGMYPYRAIQTAGDLMLGRRLKLLLRWLFMMLCVAIAAVCIEVPIILLDMGIKALWPALAWLPIVPISLVIFASFAIIWVAAYVYLLYRKVVDYVPE